MMSLSSLSLTTHDLRRGRGRWRASCKFDLVFILFKMNNDIALSTSEPSKELMVNGVNKIQVKRLSKLPVHVGKSGGMRYQMPSS